LGVDVDQLISHLSVEQYPKINIIILNQRFASSHEVLGKGFGQASINLFYFLNPKPLT